MVSSASQECTILNQFFIIIVSMKKLSSRWGKLGQILRYFLSRELGMTVVENSENISLSLGTVVTVCTHKRIGMLLKCVFAYSIAFCLYTLNWRTRIKKVTMNWFFFWIFLLTDSFHHKLFIGPQLSYLTGSIKTVFNLTGLWVEGLWLYL